MTTTDRLKAAWRRALADPSAVVDAATTSPDVQAALIGWLPSHPHLEKVNWGTVLRETEKGTGAWYAVQILGLMMRRKRLESTATAPHAHDVMLAIEGIWDEFPDEAESYSANDHAICKHLAKLGRSPDATDGSSLLTLVVEAMPSSVMIREASPFCLKKRGSLPHFDRMDEDEDRALPNPPRDFVGDRSSQLEFDIPELGSVVKGTTSWLLWMFDAAGGKSLAQGRGAPWTMRLWIGAMLHLGINQRDGRWHMLRFPTFRENREDGELAGVTDWLHPDGWANKRRDWERFPAALDEMRDRLAYVPCPGLGSVAMLFPSVIPRSPNDPLVEFAIRVPRSGAQGARVDWKLLCRYGNESAALYRAYLSAMAFLDRSAHHGHPITRRVRAPILDQDGKPLRRKDGAIVRSVHETIPNSLARYVTLLHDADLARMIGFDPSDRKRRFDARRAFERLCEDGVIDLSRADRKGFWRLFGPAKSTK